MTVSEELESALHEVLVELEHPAVPGVGVDDELTVRESSIEVDGVLGGHHLVALTVHDEHRLVDAREVGGLLLTPSVDGLELGAERAYGDGLVAVVRTFLKPCQELLSGSAAVLSPREEEELLGVLAGEQSPGGVEVGDAGHLVDAFAPRGAGSGEDHLAHELRLLVRDHLRGHATQGEPDEVDPADTEGTDEGDGVPRHLLDGRRRGPAGGTDTAVVEGDDPMLGGDAVHDSGVPVVQDCGQVGEEDHRHAGIWAELSVGELHAVGVDGLRRRGLPGRGQTGTLRQSRTGLAWRRGSTPRRSSTRMRIDLTTRVTLWSTTRMTRKPFRFGSRAVKACCRLLAISTAA